MALLLSCYTYEVSRYTLRWSRATGVSMKALASKRDPSWFRSQGRQNIIRWVFPPSFPYLLHVRLNFNLFPAQTSRLTSPPQRNKNKIYSLPIWTCTKFITIRWSWRRITTHYRIINLYFIFFLPQQVDRHVEHSTVQAIRQWRRLPPVISQQHIPLLQVRLTSDARNVYTVKPVSCLLSCLPIPWCLLLCQKLNRVLFTFN